MNRQTDTGNKVWYIALSLIATIITCLVFLTGKNLPDFFETKQPPTIEKAATKINDETPQQTVFIFHKCAMNYYANSSGPIELQYGTWAAKTPEILEENLKHISIEIRIDGVPVGGTLSQKRLPISKFPCTTSLTEGYWAYHSTTVKGLVQGKHSIEIKYIFDSKISDGYDLNNDGLPEITSDPIIRTYTLTIQ